jgi:signal transduction histidine kinase
MLDTVADLLDVAKIEQGKMTLNKAQADLNALIKEHIGVFAYVAKEKNIVISYEEKETALFAFDSVRVGQVINNLLSNSLKFTNEGGKVDVKIDQKDGQIEVVVSDTGIGIPQDKKAFLFTKFGQIDHSKSNVGPNVSSGLGLFICTEIVEAQGGKSWVDSQEGVGTKITFTLPINAEKKLSDVREFAN